MRLVVRSNELACRNGWNADLWVPANAEGDAQRPQPIDGIANRAASEVAPAAQNDLITSIVAAKTDNVTLPENRTTLPPANGKPAVEEDIFVNQTPSLTWRAPRNGPISAQPATELVQNPKAAILRARDQFRQRRKTEGRLADQRLAEPASTFLASSREARLVHEHDLVPPEPDPESVDPRFENRQLLKPQTPRSYDDHRPVSPVTPHEVERPFPSMTDFPEDRARFESIPYVEAEAVEDEIVDILQDDTWIETRQIDTVLPEPYVVDDFFEEDELVAEVEPAYFEDEELSVHHRESILNRFLRQRRERRQQPEYPEYIEEPYEDMEELPAIAARSADPAPPVVSEDPDWLLPQTHEPARNGDSDLALRPAPSPADFVGEEPSRYLESLREPSALRSERRPEVRVSIQPAALEEDDFVIPPPLPEYQPSEYQQTQSFETRQRPRIEPERAYRQPPVQHREAPLDDEFGSQPLFASQPLPATEDIELEASFARSERAAFASPRLERVCQTCRDFRPAENGERGWCNNKWAFNHRRMVDADDLACRNSLGSWWTPKDESWRRDGDISRHAQQTPRVDQWLLGNRENDTDRRRSGS